MVSHPEPPCTPEVLDSWLLSEPPISPSTNLNKKSLGVVEYISTDIVLSVVVISIVLFSITSFAPCHDWPVAEVINSKDFSEALVGFAATVAEVKPSNRAVEGSVPSKFSRTSWSWE